MARIRAIITVLVALMLLLAACGGGDENEQSSTSSAGGSNQTSAAANAAFSIEYSTGLALMPDNARVRNPQYTTPILEIDENGTGNGFLRLEFDNDTLAVGEEPLFRVTIAATAEIDGAQVQIGCKGTSSDTENLNVTITAMNDEQVSGEFSFAVGNCTDYLTGEAVQLTPETVTISGTFSDVPVVKVGA